MTIPTGVYGIFTTADTRVGRAANEVKDVRPKRVFTNTDATDPTWVVEKLPNGNYLLCARNAPTAALDGGVFALIVDQIRRTEWRLQPVRDGLFRYFRRQKAPFQNWSVCISNIHQT